MELLARESASRLANSGGLHSNDDAGERGVDFRNIRMKDEKQTAALNFVAVNQLSRTARPDCGRR